MGYFLISLVNDLGTKTDGSSRFKREVRLVPTVYGPCHEEHSLTEVVVRNRGTHSSTLDPTTYYVISHPSIDKSGNSFIVLREVVYQPTKMFVIQCSVLDSPSLFCSCLSIYCFDTDINYGCNALTVHFGLSDSTPSLKAMKK